MKDTWNLDILYKSFQDEEFIADTKTLDTLIGNLADLAQKAPEMDSLSLIREFLALQNNFALYTSKLFIYANLRYSANTADPEAASTMGVLMGKLSATAAPSAALNKLIAGIENLEDLIKENSDLAEYEFYLTNIKEASKHLLSDAEESLFAEMNISGASAWSDLQSSLTSSLKVDYNGEKITLPAVRNLAYEADAEVRKNAYEAELASYDQIKTATAFALNSIKQQVISESARRGYSSPLDKALSDSRMTKETLDALISAMEDYLPAFRKYLKAKAKYLGHEGGLPWYDLFAPIGSSDKKYTIEESRDYLLGIFGKFDTDLHDMVKTAFDEAWIDFYPREGKVGGAFDCGVPSAKQSRVLTNFGGAFGDIVTLAHELGHSYHDRQVFNNALLNQEYSMPVAETASTFNEVLVVSTAIAESTDREEKLALLESQLQDATQIIVDIYSRYTFEASVFEHRPTEFMSADRFSELMLAAQEKAYGDGLDKDLRHPYMWVCKGHYYSGGLSFYNFPYAFGGLFARGLYAKYLAEGKPFVDTYKALLRATGTSTVENAAKIAGVDLTQKSFWEAGLKSLADQIEEFCTLVDYKE